MSARLLRLARTLSALACLHALALALFASGFLLTRVELAERSGCADFPPPGGAQPGDCWAPAAFDKAVLLVLDGLRWDVASGAARSQVAGRSLALPSLARLARGGALLAPFRADAPTTTQQRLRALLTGSLPTFLELGASFGAPALGEDSLVAQAAGGGRRLVHAGDDAWLQLFPPASGAWARAHPFPSLDVRDLHGVDRGVAALLPELLRSPGEWDVLIAHFLGIDHAGHTFGWDSAEMASKLAELDEIVSRTHAALTSNASAHHHRRTLFLVLGDHGMTWAGAHGGASEAETLTALLADAPGRRRPESDPGQSSEEVQQLDFAASFALLLGLPIPFGSVGRLSPQLWALAGAGGAAGEAALRANAAQVARALGAYAAAGGLPAPPVRAALGALEAAGGAEHAPPERLDAFLAAAAAAARAEWTQFHAPRMAAGLALLLASLGAHCAALAAVAGGDAWRLPRPPMLRAAPPLLALAHAAGAFSVFCMHAEAGVGHAAAMAAAVAQGAAAALSGGVRRRAALFALPLATAGLYLARMGGEDKPGGEAGGWLRAGPCLVAMATLPAVLLPSEALRLGPPAAAAAATSVLAHAALAARMSLPLYSAAAAAAWGTLLARLVYALGALGLCCACAHARGGGERGRLALSALAPPLLLLSGRSAPPLALLAAAQAGATLALHAPAAGEGGGAAAARCVSLGAGLHLFARQLFFAGGHASSFDALHFASAFIGFDGFSFARQGALLAANTWAAELAAAAMLPLAAAAASAAPPASAQYRRALALIALTRAALRCADATAAAVAASALRRHLHVWSHFAPKFVFEAVALLLVDALLLLGVWLAGAVGEKAHES